MKSIKEALIVFKVFSMNDTYLEWDAELKHIEETIRAIDSIIMQGYFSVIKSMIEYFCNRSLLKTYINFAAIFIQKRNPTKIFDE